VGLIYHYLADTAYDRGGSRSNKEEARIVAKQVMDHARSRPNLTLGVSTFSTTQMEAVQNELEIVRREDPSCEQRFFNAHPEEPFFVKNLENVQGDERDIIFISIGYGRDANGRLTMNFGPLNQDGGERRLNVLITRARRRCEVFSNLTADDIDLSRTDARGVKVLKRYLKYAETDELDDMPKPTGREADSPFEEEVAYSLRKRGYQVEHQIGSAGYFIDLGVKDPERPGRYLLGIECDGATYHSAQSARDRDRLRQQVLEGLGWRIHRIWSTDWFRNPDRELRRAAEAIEEARAYVTSPPELSPENNVLDSNESGEEPEPNPDITVPPAPEPQEISSTEKHKLAKLFISTGGVRLHEVTLSKMANWIQDVVKIESPVHLDEVARRIATAVGASRKKVKTAARQATRSGSVQIGGEFLYWTEQGKITVRDRSELPKASRKLVLIAPEEMEAATKQVVSDAFGIDRDDLTREVCWLFGFKPASAKMRQEIEKVVERLIEDKQLIWQGNSLLIP
jgi:very-short-patch-repair endonuclease